MKAPLSAVFALLLGALALGALVPFAIRDASPLYGELPLATARGGIVTVADPDTALRRGDTIEWRKVPLDDRYGSIRRPMAGITVTYPFLRGGVEHYAHLRSVPLDEATPLAYKIVIGVKVAAWVFFVLLALAIVLKRPSLMTWGFYVYALGNTEDSAAGLSLLPAFPFYAVQLGATLLSLLSAVGLMIFALRFPDDRADGWRATVEKFVPFLLFAYVGFAVWATYGEMTLTLDWAHATRWALLLPFPPYVVAWIALVDSYRLSIGATRLRLRWALIGLFIGTLLPGLAIPLQGITLGATFLESESFAAFANIAVPLTMGYAIVRHRVIDVEFVANRAIVLGTVAAFLAGTFVLLDWLYANYLTQTRWQIAVGIVVAFALGWAARSGRRTLINAVDKIFFPKRHHTMQSIYELRAGLEDVAGAENANRFVVNRAAIILELDSAAVFNSMPDGGFLRQAAVGWDAGTAWHLFADDAIVEQLTKQRGAPARLGEHAWSNVQVPAGAARPILAVPLGAKRSAFAVYGAHADGRGIDPDEMRGLMDLCSAAAAIRAA